jgi:amino acid transporter
MSQSSPSGPARTTTGRMARPMQVIVVSSVMFTFISCWKTAAVVLCDLASTAYYIGGIVEGAIGPAAPWMILVVMLFSYAVRSIYIESCSLFVRGGVYRVVKEAMGGFLAKLSVSALMFDYTLTGPISAVSSGQYILGLAVDTFRFANPAVPVAPETADMIRHWGAVVIAVTITLYFYRQNILGIHESSSKALKIMIATTIMAVVMLAWCGLTLAVRGPANWVPLTPDLSPKVEYQVVTAKDRITGEEKEMWLRDPRTGRLVVEQAKDPVTGQMADKPKINEAAGHQEDPLGMMSWLFPGVAAQLRRPGNWLSLIGVLGIFVAFGHSILAMSGEETLAQVYREVEAPKMKNFQKAAFIVFVYSLGLTASISFLAVLIIPDEVRMKLYSDNLIGGLAMYMAGPVWAKLLLNAFVVVVGFLILAGAVNTAIIGSNGVLNRVAEDGVVPDWFLKPHSRYGTTYRMLTLIVAMQLLTILLSRGDMYVLGEAYAFGVVWSFVFKAWAMVVLRFKDKTPREFRVPGNVHIGGVEIPFGLLAVFLVLLATAFVNLMTKEVATIGGMAFTAVFLGVFMASEHFHNKRLGGAHHHHLEQFNQTTAEDLSAAGLGMDKPYRKLVAIRSTQNLFMLEKALAETDPETTDVAVMTAQVTRRGDESAQPAPQFDQYNRELMTAVVTRAEKAGKHVQPLIVQTNNPLFAVVQTAYELQVQELVIGASNIHTADTQLDQIGLYWINLHGGEPAPLTVRVLSRTRDLSFDLGGGNRIPKIGERRARSVAELRAAGVGVKNVLLVHDGTSNGSDLFNAALTMLDPEVAMTVVHLPQHAEGESLFRQDLARAAKISREIECRDLSAAADPVSQVLAEAASSHCDLMIVGAADPHESVPPVLDLHELTENSPCRMCVITSPRIPDRVDG